MWTSHPPGPPLTDADRRTLLAEAVEKLALALEIGVVTPQPVELQALAAICDEQSLHVEAARIRRWLA